MLKSIITVDKNKCWLVHGVSQDQTYWMGYRVCWGTYINSEGGEYES